jgi:hypothetical protein
MKKRYIYHPNDTMSDWYAVKEFVGMMEMLEKAHGCKVRMVKTCGLILHKVLYELVDDPAVKKVKK